MNLLKKFSKKKVNVGSFLKSGLKKFVPVICYPFKLWWVWLLIVIIAYLAPTFNGVKPAEVHLWYWNKIVSSVSAVSDSVVEKADSLIKKVDISNPFSSGDTDNRLQMFEQKASSGRKAFVKSDSSPRAVDIMKRDANVNVPQGVVPVLGNSGQALAENEIVKVPTADLSFASADDYRRDLPSLVYLDTPKTISGMSFVYHANAIDVDGTYVLLFGVYTSPQSDQGINAAIFLESLIENKNVSCKIVAFTKQDVPTGICFINDININKLLVLKGLSENVALY